MDMPPSNQPAPDDQTQPVWTSPFVELPPPVEPVSPVASSTACAAWPAAVLTMIPLLGSLPGIVLAALSIRLITKPCPLPHDRRVGWAGLILALTSISFTATTLANYVLADVPSTSEDGFAASTLPTTRDGSEPETPAVTSSPVGPHGQAERPRSQPAHSDQDSEGIIDTEMKDFEPAWSQRILYLAVLVISIVFHEVGHAVAAYWSGDPTARDQGRFSLNPIHHMEWFGSVILPAILTLISSPAVIGWARPVPVRPQRFRNSRRGQLGVALAGVSLNLLIALIATHLLAFILTAFSRLNPEALVANVVHPLLPPVVLNAAHPQVWTATIALCKAAVWTNIILMGLNLLPFPPLDGFNALRAVAPVFLTPLLTRLTGLGMIFLFCIILFDVLSYLLIPPMILAMLLLWTANLCAG